MAIKEIQPALPNIIYQAGVNESTPYLVKIDPEGFGNLLVEEFGFSVGELNKVDLIISSKKTANCLADARLWPTFPRPGLKRIITIYMGNIWEQDYSPKSANFFNRWWRYRKTKEEIVRSLAHESSHITNGIEKDKQALEEAVKDAVKGVVLGTVGDLLLTRSIKISKVANILAYTNLAKASFNVFKMFINTSRDMESDEELARKNQLLINVSKWIDIVELKENQLV